MIGNSPLLIILLIIGGWNFPVSAQDEAQLPIVEDDSPTQINEALQEGYPPIGWPTQEDYEDIEDEQYPMEDVTHRSPNEIFEETVTSEDGVNYRQVYCSYNCPSNGNTSPLSCTVESLYNKEKVNNGDVEVSPPVPQSCSNKIVKFRESGRNVDSAFARANFIFPQTGSGRLEKFFVNFYDHSMFPYEYQVTLGQDVHYWEYAVNVTVDVCDFYVRGNSPFMMEVASSPYKTNEVDTAYCTGFHHTQSCCEDPDLLHTYPCTEINCSPDGQSPNHTMPAKTLNEEIRELKQMIVDMQVENEYTKYQMNRLDGEMAVMVNKRVQQFFNSDIIISNFTKTKPETARILQRRIVQLFREAGVTEFNINHISLCTRMKYDTNGVRYLGTPKPLLVRFALHKHKIFILHHLYHFYSRGIRIRPRMTNETELLLNSAWWFMKNHESFRTVVSQGADLFLVTRNNDFVPVESQNDLDKLWQMYPY